MNNYVTYSSEELAQDAFFIQWVNATDLAAEHFWQDWLETYPFKRKDVEMARQLVLLVNQAASNNFSQAEIEELKSSIFAQIESFEKPTKSIKVIQRWYWAIAASVAFMVLGIFWYKSERSPQETYLAQIKKAKQTYRLNEISNQTTEQQLVNLPDGSSVLLKKGATISYPSSFTQDWREVYLTGEAFFEVAKDANKPFLVHANQVITKVLGTSFTIKTEEHSSKVRVNVKTGRVAVYLADTEEALRQPQSKKLEGLVLLPGEQVVVEKQVISAVQQAQVATNAPTMVTPIERISFEFNENNLKEVFSRIEQAYHLKVEYDEQLMGNCPVTASLTDEPLNQKLHLICKAVRASYILTEGKVVVTGRGCQ